MKGGDLVAVNEIKNCYTKIPNDMLEAMFRLDISGNEMRIFLYIIRRTYGFHRDSAEISLTEIASAVGRKKTHVSNARKKLEGMSIIERRSAQGSHPQMISVSEKITHLSETVTENGNPTVTENGNPMVTENGNPMVTENGNPTVTENGNYTYKERKKDIKEIFKERENEKKSYGRNGRVWLTDEEYQGLVDDYGKDTAHKFIERMDLWIRVKKAVIEDCESELRLWLERENVPKLDPDIEKYKCLINRF